MAVATLQEATKKLGLSPNDMVQFYRKGTKMVIELDTTATEKDITHASLNDHSEDFLTDEELKYYLNLEEL